MQWSYLRTFGCCLFPLPRVILPPVSMAYLLSALRSFPRLPPFRGAFPDPCISNTPYLSTPLRTSNTSWFLLSSRASCSGSSSCLTVSKCPLSTWLNPLEILDSCPQRIILFMRSKDVSLRRHAWPSQCSDQYKIEVIRHDPVLSHRAFQPPPSQPRSLHSAL